MLEKVKIQENAQGLVETIYRTANYEIKEVHTPTRGMGIVISKSPLAQDEGSIPQLMYSAETNGIMFNIEDLLSGPDLSKDVIAEIKEIQKTFVDEALCPVFSLESDSDGEWVNI